MIAEAAQVAAEVVKQHTASTETLIGLAILVVSNIGLWLDRAVQVSKNRADQEKAEAAEAEAKAASKPASNGNGIHEKYILPHSLKIQELEGKVQVMDQRMSRFEVENSAQHDKMFTKLDDIKDLVIGKSSGAA